MRVTFRFAPVFCSAAALLAVSSNAALFIPASAGTIDGKLRSGHNVALHVIDHCATGMAALIDCQIKIVVPRQLTQCWSHS